MRIGTVEISSKLALAPMAGVTDAAFRQICSELGAGYTITELISSKALCYHDKKTFSLLTQFPGEHPAAVQIFGSDPVCMAEAAAIALEELKNIGVRALVRIGSCGALQKGIGLGDLILGCGAIRDDGASKAYVHTEYPAVADYRLLGFCVDAAKDLGCRSHVGIIHSHESFYHEENDAESAYWSRKGALGADMESAALFTIGRLRGMKTASILNNVVVYGEDTADAIGGYVDGESLTARGEQNEIRVALEALYRLEQERGQ